MRIFLIERHGYFGKNNLVVLLKVTINDYKYNDNLFMRVIKNILFKKIKRIDTDKLADEVSNYMIEEMIRNLRKEGSIVTYTLAESIEKEKVDEGKYIIRVNAPYAPIVEHGRGARGDGIIPEPQQNINPYAIEEWVRMKFGYTGKRAKDVTFAIINALRTKGHFSHPFFEPAIYNTKLWFGMNKDKLKKIIIKGENI